MVWRESFPKANELSLDAEAERERRLAAQARAGADWALTALVARYQPAVTRYLTRLCGDQTRARELAERVFQRMERRLHGPQGADNLRLWLLRASTEAGLEALRRPRRTQPARLGATPVAGLLASETGGAQAALRGGIKRLRGVVGAVSRQARPLVWQGAEPNPPDAPSTLKAEAARVAMNPGPETSQDALDPRDALRHRLIRLTLADLPYGDAQCLALHLVAGLNQAEVARALGLTNSATRKRIVQGLAQFSTRYRTAVRSLGLPEELGYGEAAPRRTNEPALVFTPPEPATTVVVAQTAGEPNPAVGFPTAAPPTVPLSVESYDEQGEMVSGVMYYTRTTGDLPEMPAAARDLFMPVEGPLMPAAPGFSDYPAYATFSDLDDDRAGAVQAAGSPEDIQAAGEPAHAGAPAGERPAPGAVTRIAADAIVGPVVDALPVDSEPLTLEPEIGAPGSRSVPLAYELASGHAQVAASVTMNWIDSSGMLAPLSFEAIVMPNEGDTLSSEDPWERSMILDFESMSHPGQRDETVEPDIAWEPPSGGERAEDFAPGVSAARDESDHTGSDDAGRAAPVTRTLEDLWDEAPDL